MRVEGPNSFKYRYVSGAVIAGRPDIIALDGGTALVCDCKTGRPRTADRIQVTIYLYLLPFCFTDLGL